MTPTTPAGQALHDACRRPSTATTRPEVQDAITAIEAEAAATERARIAELVEELPYEFREAGRAVLAAIEGESK